MMMDMTMATMADDDGVFLPTMMMDVSMVTTMMMSIDDDDDG